VAICSIGFIADANSVKAFEFRPGYLHGIGYREQEL